MINCLELDGRCRNLIDNKLQKRQTRALLRAQKLKRKKQTSLLHNYTFGSWFKLDNAATVYPSAKEDGWTYVFRLSAILKENVDKAKFQQAISDVIPRFPSFNVSLKRGFFWYYFDEINKAPLLQDETKFPCTTFDTSSTKQHLLRFLVNNKRVSLECFHALTDGRGALVLLNSVLHRYFNLTGTPIETYEGCLCHRDIPKLEEISDSFFEFANRDRHIKTPDTKAFKIRGTDEQTGVINTLDATMSVSKLKEIAKKHNANIFTFLLGCLAHTFSRIYKYEKKPIKFSIPIDLRRFFPSETLRNFSGYINITIENDGRTYSLGELIEIIQKQLEKINRENMQNFINGNVALQRNLFIKVIPLFIKNPIINICYNSLGENYQTVAISNIGIVKTPKEFEERIEKYTVNLGRTKYNKKSVGIISFGDKLVLTISSNIKENRIERDFLRELADLGVEILLESNRRDIYG